MWLGVQIVRAAGGDVSGLTVAVAALAVVATVATALLGFRGTLRTVEVQREAAYGKRVDERLARLEERNLFLESELARYREMYTQLRLDVIAHGLDPDAMGGRASFDEAP
ncbi:hypothetical protein [Micromonospora cathayae]|uniref:Secreted protein n=1 Tax=Micromonospora cathayae TaxID=3028804 RepID=A0ABY7ZNC2_9ACTN|nr:hypothetical protein [Micromonospora sp. HUAS 3]WDZ84003.1 hypothetical protein PVK37_26605 [Micromonospora sp. HUAS 3]